MLNLIHLAAWGAVYSGLIVLAITAEHGLFAQKLARHELVRTTMGVFTVMAISLPFALWGVFSSAELWALIMLGFGAAGATTGLLYSLEGGLPTYIVKTSGPGDGKGLRAILDISDSWGE